MAQSPAPENNDKVEAPKLTFLNDALQRGPFAKRLERYLIVESDFVEGSVVAALNAPFGSGKSTFIEMWKNDLLERRLSPNADGFEAPMPVILNAWESDFCGDPLVAILSGLLKAVENWKGKDAPETESTSKIKEAVKDLGWYLLGLGNSVAAHAVGVDAIAAAEYAENKKKERHPEPPDFIANFNKRQDALHKLRSALEETFAGETPKVIIFVDELDRCRPDYAIHYLETIKHVFNVKGIIFLLAVDAHQLEVSAKALFGNDLNFPEYFRKFCHRSFTLPESSIESTSHLLAKLVDKHVTCSCKRKSSFREGPYITQMAEPLIRHWKLIPRQLIESFRILGHALIITQKNENSEFHNQTISLVYLYLCMLRIADNEAYKLLEKGKYSPNHINLFYQTELEKNCKEQWTELYLTGTNMHLSFLENNIRGDIQLLRSQGEWQDMQSKMKQALGNQPYPFKQICHQIENAMYLEEVL